METQLKAYTGKNFYLLTLQKLLRDGEVTLSDTQRKFAQKLLDKESPRKHNIPDLEIDWSPFSVRPPYDFQKEAVKWLSIRNKAILADMMGLGKSLESIIASLVTNESKVLIVCPATLKLNWKREIEYFCPDVSIVGKAWSASTRYVIINYDILHKYVVQIQKAGFTLVISDESHMVKNLQSRRTKSFIKINNKIKKTWLLTGTPIANRPIDFYSLLKICKHSLGSNKFDFGMKYCDGKPGYGRSMDFSGASNLNILHELTKDIMLRRRVDDVLGLPEKIKTPVSLELPSKREYIKCIEDAVNASYQKHLEKQLLQDPFSSDFVENEFSGEGEQFIQMAAARRFCSENKVPATCELIDNILEGDEKIVVFTNYLNTIDLIAAKYPGICLTLDGRIKSLEERQRRIDQFQNDPKIRIIICNFAIAAVGITLTSGSVAIMNDLPWSPYILLQAESRLHRIGQKKRTNIYYPLFEDSIDLLMFNVLKDKIGDISIAVEGKENIDTLNIQKIIYREFMNSIKR